MLRAIRVSLALALVVGSLAVSKGLAQAPSGSPAPVSGEPEILRALPRPPEQPASLLAPARPVAQLPPLPGPYFEDDPRLDPPYWPQPGWFADVDFLIAKAHVKNRLVGSVQIGDNPADTVHVPGAVLDWTVSPRFEMGYRLASGFGAFALSYRFLATSGAEVGPGPDGVAALKSQLDMHIIDLDYISREFSLWPEWEMQWRFGLRWASVYFDARSEEPFDMAAAGSGIFAARTTDRFVGFGPHVGGQLVRHLAQPGLSLVGQSDLWLGLGRIRQGFFEESTTLGPNGLPLNGESHDSSSQTVPALNLLVGLSYKPPSLRDLEFFLGYQYEHWWNVGRFSKGASRGELSDQGVLLRAAFNF
jgi:hypothetical protein